MKIQYFIAILVVGVMAVLVAGCASEEPESPAASLPGRETTADPNVAPNKMNAGAAGTASPQ
jgi:predicted component of type VI protein secretion system